MECRKALIQWNSFIHCNAASKIKEIQHAIHLLRDTKCDNSGEKIQKLKKDLSEAYKSKEVYWQQKSRVQWLKEGDKNTAFFHISTSNRRRKNKISRLKRANGEWCETDGL